MLVQQRRVTKKLRLNLAVEQSLLDRLEKVRKAAEARGLGFYLEEEVVRFIAGQVSRAESVLKESKAA